MDFGFPLRCEHSKVAISVSATTQHDVRHFIECIHCSFVTVIQLDNVWFFSCLANFFWPMVNKLLSIVTFLYVPWIVFVYSFVKNASKVRSDVFRFLPKYGQASLTYLVETTHSSNSFGPYLLGFKGKYIRNGHLPRKPRRYSSMVTYELGQ